MNLFELPIEEFKKEVKKWLDSKSEEEILEELKEYRLEEQE